MAFVTLKNGVEKNQELKKELVAWCENRSGRWASPDKIPVSPTVYPRPEAVKSCADSHPYFAGVSQKIWAIPSTLPTHRSWIHWLKKDIE